jgi:hypothetical protein
VSAEELLREARIDDQTGTDALAVILAAASAPGRESELSGEGAAVAAFREARDAGFRAAPDTADSAAGGSGDGGGAGDGGDAEKSVRADAAKGRPGFKRRPGRRRGPNRGQDQASRRPGGPERGRPTAVQRLWGKRSMRIGALALAVACVVSAGVALVIGGSTGSPQASRAPQATTAPSRPPTTAPAPLMATDAGTSGKAKATQNAAELVSICHKFLDATAADSLPQADLDRLVAAAGSSEEIAQFCQQTVAEAATSSTAGRRRSG